jgi:hypothetical protein
MVVTRPEKVTRFRLSYHAYLKLVMFVSLFHICLISADTCQIILVVALLVPTASFLPFGGQKVPGRQISFISFIIVSL